MKIVILFLTLIALNIVASEEMCRTIEVRVTSSMQSQAQTFTLDVKKIRDINFSVSKENFEGSSLVPLEQVGFILEKTASSKTLDAIHHKYFRNEPEQIWLPYSYTGDWTINGYYIFNQMTRTSTSKTEKPLVKFEFVNDVDLDSVSPANVNDILKRLEHNSQQRIETKTYVKEQIIKANDGYTTTKVSYETKESVNKDSKTEITKYKQLLKTVEEEIVQKTTTITTNEEKKAQSDANYDSINNELNKVIEQITVIEKEIAKAQFELESYKPTDVTIIQNHLHNYLQIVEMPKQFPWEFLQEYSYSTTEKYNIVQKAYTNCNKNKDTIIPCMEAVGRSDVAAKKRKLRRGFF